MPTTSNLYLMAFALVMGTAFFIAAKSRARRIEKATDRYISPEARKQKDDEVLRLLGSGEKIKALKSYREFYQTGLKEAKDAVELLENKRA